MLIGFDWGGTKIEGIALDEAGVTLMRERVPTPRDDYDGCIRAVVGLAERFERETGRSGQIGFGVPGSLSPTTGLIRNANSTWMNDRPLKQDLEAALGRPVRIENDANCLAVSEAVDGAGAGARMVFAVIIGTGCGSGIAIDRRPWTGRNAIAGEIGHNPLPWAAGPNEDPGPSCWCGKRGCIESFISGQGFARDHALTSGVATRGETIVAQARHGDTAAQASLASYVDRLARTFATVMNLLDPDVIVLGGGMSNVDEIYTALPQRLARYVFADAIDTPVRKATHGDSSGVRGAAWLWKP